MEDLEKSAIKFLNEKISRLEKENRTRMESNFKFKDKQNKAEEELKEAKVTIVVQTSWIKKAKLIIWRLHEKETLSKEDLIFLKK